MEISFLVVLLCGDSCAGKFALVFTGTTCMACVPLHLSPAFLKLKNVSF